jgi:hypothetical protein
MALTPPPTDLVAMAARLAKAFKYPRKALMEMQARYDAAQATQKDAPADTQAYVPPFLAIKANDIEGWISHNIPARTRLAVFLRTLVHSTSSGFTKVDFPGNDDAERPGWDGFLEAREGTPWVPAGRSGWEFGTNEDPIAADSTEEALAFLAQLLGERGGEELASYRDRVLVFDQPGVLPRLAAGAQTFIPVVFTREVERELAPYAKSMRSIVIYPRNASTTAPACRRSDVFLLGPQET